MSLLHILLICSILPSLSHYKSPLKCQDPDGSAQGCTVEFTDWREQNQIQKDHLVCSVAIRASIRSFPLTCPTYSLSGITISDATSPIKQTLDFTVPSSGVTSCKASYADLSLRKRNTNITDLMSEMFCPYGFQPDSCELSTPQIEIKTTKWDPNTCSKESCHDGIPLSININLAITTKPTIECPTADAIHQLPCSGYMNRTDQLPRGFCGCRTLHYGQKAGNAELTCTCEYGYFGESCQSDCPGGIAVAGQSGLIGCCHGNGKPVFSTDQAQAICECYAHFTGDACNECLPGFWGDDCTNVCSTTCNGLGNQPSDACHRKTGSCSCVTQGWNAFCTDCQSDVFGHSWYGRTCTAQCGACNGTGSAVPRGSCDSGLNGTGKCQCMNDYWNEDCTDCLADRYGSTCSSLCQCSNPNEICASGPTGDGRCMCRPPFDKSIDGTCDECISGYYGTLCKPCDCGAGGSGSKTGHWQCNDGRNGTGGCGCLEGWQGAACDQSTGGSGDGGIPLWVAPLVGAVILFGGAVGFLVLYKRQQKINLNLISRGNSHLENGESSINTSPRSNMSRSNMSRPLLSPRLNGGYNSNYDLTKGNSNGGGKTANNRNNDYPSASISSDATLHLSDGGRGGRDRDRGGTNNGYQSGGMNNIRRQRTNSGMVTMMDLLLDSPRNSNNTNYQTMDSKMNRKSVVEHFDKLLLISNERDDYTIDYELLDVGAKIGSGASGEVFTAVVRQSTKNPTVSSENDLENPENATPIENEEPIVVAVKRLFADTVDKNYFADAFSRELHLLRRMDHINVVRLIGVSISPDKHYHIVTELCRCALNDLLDRGKGRLPNLLLKDITLQVVSGMKYLHDNNIVHRDLKPANCLIAGGGDSGALVVKICDFGLSRLVQHDVTMMTAEIGTPAYMAPEMASEGALDSVEAGKAIDVFSFSVCCLEIWTQEKPYKNKKLNAFQLMVKVMKGQRPEIPVNRLPNNIIQTIQKCWSQEPKERPSFEKVKEAMDNNIDFFDMPALKDEMEDATEDGMEKDAEK